MLGNLLLAVTVLSAVPPLVKKGDYSIHIKGGTRADQQRVARAVEKVPACLRNCDGKPLRVEVTVDDAAFSEAAYYEKTKKFPEAVTLQNVGTQGSKASIRDTALVSCIKPKELNKVLGNASRTILHESAHKLDFNCLWKGKKRGIHGFFALGYRQKRDAYHGDPAVRRMRKELFALFDKQESLAKRGKDLSDKDFERICDLQQALQKKYDATGAPSRYNPDRHALDSGAEYFAIAIETLVHDHAEFCSAYSEAERQWLWDNLGECLSQLTNTAPCFGPGNGAHRGMTLEK